MSTRRAHWPAKDPAEARVASILCAEEMDDGETISSVAVTISVLSGVDAGAAAMLYQSATISGSTVYQPFRDGVAGVTYLLRAVITLSSGRILVGTATLPVETA